MDQTKSSSMAHYAFSSTNGPDTSADAQGYWSVLVPSTFRRMLRGCLQYVCPKHHCLADLQIGGALDVSGKTHDGQATAFHSLHNLQRYHTRSWYMAAHTV